MAIDKQQRNEEKGQLLQCVLPIGTVLDNGKSHRYKVLDVLGVGGFGITYKVSSQIFIGNVATTLCFALKEHFMKGCFRGDDGKTVLCVPNVRNEFIQSKDDFITEAERLNKLGKLSANIVKVNEHFEANGTAYYVMEYLDGGDLLHHVIKNGALSESEALSKICPIAKAVELLHADGLLHLDIKPSNIVLKTDSMTSEQLPILIDFGIAKHFDKSGMPTSRLVAKGASDGYAPMEQYTDITHFSPEIDVYALGATLYFCLTGQNPPKAFDISSVTELMNNLPTNTPQRTKSAIIGAMQRNNFDRTRTIKAFLASLEQNNTLPIGTILHSMAANYRIVEVIGEAPLYIKYRAVLATPSLHTSMGTQKNETSVFSQYYIYEWFVKGTDKRLNTVILSPQSFRSAGDSNAKDCFVSKVMPFIPKAYLSQRDQYGYKRAELFEENNTVYYSCAIIPQAPLWERMFAYCLNTFRRIINAVAIHYRLWISVLAVTIIGYSLPKAVEWYNNRPHDTAEPTTQDATVEDTPIMNETGSNSTVVATPSPRKKTNDELFKEAKTINDYKKLADTGYTKAFYPLASKYFANGNDEEAHRWANKCVSKNVDVALAKTLLKRIEEKNVQKAISEADWDAVIIFADKGYEQTYAPLATHYLDIKKYDAANSYAQKAFNADIGKVAAKKVIEMLDVLGYYDNKSKPRCLN